MLIGSLVELHAWLHSYLCFSLLEKRFSENLDTVLIPPRHLAFYRALKVFCFHNLERSSTAGGSNEKVPGSSIASQQLVDQLSFPSCVFALFLDSCICRRCFSQHLPRQMAWDLYLSRITEELYIRSSRSGSHFFNLSRSIRIYSSPKHLLSHSKPLPKWFFELFQVFLHLLSF